MSQREKAEWLLTFHEHRESFFKVARQKIQKEGAWEMSEFWNDRKAQNLGSLGLFSQKTALLEVMDFVNNWESAVHEKFSNITDVIYENKRKEVLDQEIEKYLNASGYHEQGNISQITINDKFIFNAEEYAEEVKDFWSSEDINRGGGKEKFFDRSEILPLNISLFAPTDGPKGQAKLALLKGRERNFAETFFQTDLGVVELQEQTREQYLQDLKPVHLDILSVKFEQLHLRYGSPGGLKNANNQIGGNSYNNFPGNIDPRMACGDKFEQLSNNSSTRAKMKKKIDSDFRLKIPWSLDTKLKDIHPYPHVWYYMLRMYTGCEHAIGYRGANIPDYYTESDLLDIYDPNDPGTFYEAMEQNHPDWDWDGSESSRMWYSWIQISPGLRNLLPIIIKRREEGKSNKSPADSYNHQVCYAFMELTLAEATGLKWDRIKEIFPNMFNPLQGPPPEGQAAFPGLVLGSVHHATPWVAVIDDGGAVSQQASTVIGSSEPSFVSDIVNERSVIPTDDWYIRRLYGDDATTSNDAWKWSVYYPHFLAFERPFRDPESPLNQGSEEMMKYFSGEDEPVNRELYDFLIGDSFAQSLGVGNPAEQFQSIATDTTLLETKYNFNPNIFSFYTPFTEITATPIPGQSAANLTTEMMSIFSNPNGDDQLKAIAENLNISKTKRSLLHQNVITPKTTSILGTEIPQQLTLQVNKLLDTSKVVKAGARGLDEDIKSVFKDDTKFFNEIYNFDISNHMNPEIDNLISEIFGGNGAQKILDEYEGIFGSAISVQKLENVFNEEEDFWFNGRRKTQGVTRRIPDEGPLSLEPSNFKAQTFGRLLTYKFIENFLEHYDGESNLEYITSNQESFIKNMNFILSTYGYSGLQHAYSTQMFTKLKHSRLHRRGFMKKMWKKILKSPLTSEVDPRCQQLFDQLGAPSTRDLERTETDFFDISQVKPKIIDFYKKSLCKDVYEYSTEEDNAVKKSLIEGMIIMIAKVYSLEMCLASIIAWDSFDIEDSFSDKSMLSVIIQNISEDFDIAFIAHFAAEILKKEEDLTHFEYIESQANMSSVEYLLLREIKNISKIVKSMFNNSYPLDTDLTLNILKNSDPDFKDEFYTRKGTNSGSHPAHVYAALHSERDIEYVVDCKLDNNIYTMNYGYPLKNNYYKTLNNDTSKIPAYNKSDIYGHHIRTGNKNYLHSLPMNFYDDKEYDCGYLEQPKFLGGQSKVNQWKKDAFFNKAASQFEDFQALNDMHDLFGKIGSYGSENNPECMLGNNLNAKLGNVVFQPYVKVVDWAPGEKRVDEDGNMITVDFARIEFDSSGKPCENPFTVTNLNIVDYLGVIDNNINAFRDALLNPLGCHMYGNIPLSAWSYFLTNIFLKAVKTYSEESAPYPPNSFFPLLLLYKKYGLRAFFKKVTFGMRMVYTTSYPADRAWSDSPEYVNFVDFMRQAFPSGVSTGLKDAKCLMGQRPYWVHAQVVGASWGEAKILRELQIPIVKSERDIIFKKDTGTFKLVDPKTSKKSKDFSIDSLGSWFDNAKSIQSQINMVGIDGTLSFPYGADYINQVTNTCHNFFYNNLANELLTDVKASPEFKLMYDHLFPMRRYMAMATILASDGLSKFIPEPTQALETTKRTIQLIMDNLVNSTDFKHMPDPLKNFLSNFAVREQAGTSGLEPDMTKEILKILLRTPLLILKGFVEVTDPAIILAKTIIDIANTAAFTIVSAIKMGVQIAKQTMEAGIQTAKNLLMQLEMSLAMAIAPAKAIKATLPTIDGEKLSDYVVINVGPQDEIDKWVEPDLAIKELSSSLKEKMSEDEKKTWDDFKKEFKELEGMVIDYIAAKDTLKDLEEEKEKLEEGFEKKLLEAEEILKDVFQSPYLMPGMWAALFPSAHVYGGGTVWPPFAPIGPPSTVPGMIYIALLLIDAMEEKTHDRIQALGSDPNCEDEL